MRECQFIWKRVYCNKSSRKILLVIFCGVALFAAVLTYGWQIMAGLEHASIFEEIRAGNFSTVQGLDAKQMHELEHVYKQAAENDRLLWIECDLNEDGRNELLMMESFENGRESTITGIFMEKGGKCSRILWDVQDYTSCYYLVEGMVIQYSENHGMGTRYCYVKQEIDSEGKMIQTKRFEIIDISEDDDIALSFIERGFTEPGTYYVVTDYGEDGHAPEHGIKMGKEEWMLEFGREIGDYETVNLEDYGSGKMGDKTE